MEERPEQGRPDSSSNSLDDASSVTAVPSDIAAQTTPSASAAESSGVPQASQSDALSVQDAHDTVSQLPAGLELLTTTKKPKRPKGFQTTGATEPKFITALACGSQSNVIALAYDRQVVCMEAPTGREVGRFIGHSAAIRSMQWSPSGTWLATGSADETVRVWDRATGRRLRIVKSDGGPMLAVAWSPVGDMVASADSEGTTYLWSMSDPRSLDALPTQAASDCGLLWSQDGERLYVAGQTGEIHVWSVSTHERLAGFIGHRGGALALAADWHRGFLLSGGQDRTIRLWDITTGRERQRLEGHTGNVRALVLSPDGRLLASQSSGEGASILLWRTDTWEMVASLPCPTADGVHVGWTKLAEGRGQLGLVTTAPASTGAQIWQIDIDRLIQSSQTASVQYTNAKVVLMGDTGVGKSALALVLSGQPFVATDSTHARHVWTLDDRVVPLDAHRQEQRELLLWDLGGQPGYRVIHQLYLGEVAIALAVFTAQSATDPYAGVMHWDRALRQARRVTGEAVPLVKFLVAARVDVGGTAGGFAQAEDLSKNMGFAQFFRTSAKEGTGIRELRAAIDAAVAWNEVPKVSSTELFQRIKSFLLQEKIAGHLLATTDTLFRAYQQANVEDANGPNRQNLRIQFDTCISLVEARDLIRRLSFGKLVLLQPELLDAYASALVTAAGEAADGTGSVAEELILHGEFFVPSEARLHDADQEQLLLVAVLEDLLRHELALRERTQTGNFIVFPSEISRARPAVPEAQRHMIEFTFEGPVDSLYATLVVRLAHSGLFRLDQAWRNAATYIAIVGGECALELEQLDEAKGRLILYFDDATSQETRYHFEEFVATHLQRSTLPESIQRQRLFTCQCGELISADTARRRRERGYDWLSCPVCEARVDLRDGLALLNAAPQDQHLASMERQANRAREAEALHATARGRRAVNDYGVFLCYNRNDQQEVTWLADKLVERNISPWFDEWEMRPGTIWQQQLEAQISTIPAVAVVIGPSGIGPWQNQELRAFLDEFVHSGRPVIPVILPACERIPDLPPFLKNYNWVNFQRTSPDPFDQLVWGITGQKPT